MKYKFFACLLILVGGVFGSCSNESHTQTIPAQRTVLVYMAADNSLGSDNLDEYNLTNMLHGASQEALNGGNLIVYVDPRNSGKKPQILQITPAGRKVVHEFDAAHNSASAEILTQVIAYTRERFPATSYGLILWSHGSNWFPADIATTRAFGQDVTSQQWMELPQLKAALPDHLFDFIIFDACYMGGVEVMYALQDKADYILSSPSELLSAGYPYQDIVAHLFSASEDHLQEICNRLFSFYETYTYPYCTVSMVDTRKLPALAEATRTIMQTQFGQTSSLSLADIQRYYRPSYYGMYDLDDYISRIATKDQLATFRTALKETVIYKKATSSFFPYNGGYRITHYCGLSTYIIYSLYPKANLQYQETDWYKAVFE